MASGYLEPAHGPEPVLGHPGVTTAHVADHPTSTTPMRPSSARPIAHGHIDRGMPHPTPRRADEREIATGSSHARRRPKLGGRLVVAGHATDGLRFLDNATIWLHNDGLTF